MSNPTVRIVCRTIALLLMLQDTSLSQQPADHAARPNVIVVLTDDQGYGDVGIHGNGNVVTPHLDRFARKGIRFSRFYVSPVCAPTRASLMTGRYYHRTGVIHTSRGGAKMHGDELTVAEVLRDAGYATGLFGKWHLGDAFPLRPQDQGFADTLIHRSGGIGQTPDQPNSYFNPLLWKNGRPVRPAGYCTDIFFSEAMAFIERHRDQPFFACITTNAPHTPLEVADSLVRPYLARGLDDTTARIYGMVENIDENFGRLLSHLDRLDLRDDTVVIFMTDNGPQQSRFNAGLRGRKSQTYEGGIRVPFFLQWPSRLTGGRTIDRIAAHVDLLPTIADFCRVPLRNTTRTIDGRSLLPLLTAAAEQSARSWPDRTLFFQCHRGLKPQMFQNCAAVTRKYKLVGSPGTFSREDFDASADAGFELYDLEADPGETRNLASSMPGVLKDLKSRYHAWFEEVQSERGFAPGLIHVGDPAAVSVHLCRYQDASWFDGRPDGWPVRVVRSGRYRVQARTPPTTGPLRLRVGWQGRTILHRLDKRASVELILPRGTGLLKLTLVDESGSEVGVTGNGTDGDMTVTGPVAE